MRLFLIRHGETPWNRRQRCQGVTDVPLSATGRAQAAGLAAALRGERLVAVYTSPLARALATARAVAAPHGLPAWTCEGLRELDHGACEGLTPAELAVRFAPLLAAWRRTPADVELPGGESMRAVERRAAAEVARIAARHAAHDRVAVVTHNLVILALTTRALGWPLDRFRELRVDTAAISVLDVTPDGRATPVVLNETAHLGYTARPTPPGAATQPPEDAAPRLFGDLEGPFTYVALQGLVRDGAPRLAWRGVGGRAVGPGREADAGRRYAAAAGLPLLEPPPLVDRGPALRLLADAEATLGAGARLARRLTALRFAEGRDLADPTLLVDAAAAVGMEPGRARLVLDAGSEVGAAAAARVAADEAEATERRVIGLPTAVGGGRPRTGAALLALACRVARAAGRAAAVASALAGLSVPAAGCAEKGLLAGLRPPRHTAAAATEALAETSIARVAVVDLVALAGTPDDAAFVSEALRELLRTRPGLSVAAEPETAAARGARPAGAPPTDLVRAVASEVGADAVVTGRLTRFRERDGTALAARSAASVEFFVEVRRGSDGALLWQGEFDQTQQALSESLAEAETFFRGGGRWLTARELARLGVEALARRMPEPLGPQPGSADAPRAAGPGRGPAR
jgi:broad specificity phosphatase PhoE